MADIFSAASSLRNWPNRGKVSVSSASRSLLLRFWKLDSPSIIVNCHGLVVARNDEWGCRYLLGLGCRLYVTFFFGPLLNVTIHILTARFTPFSFLHCFNLAARIFWAVANVARGVAGDFVSPVFTSTSSHLASIQQRMNADYWLYNILLHYP